MAKLSIIIPCYNVANYVKQAYESIGNEDVEIIFVIDGSPDNSEQVVREMTINDQRVKIISRPNKGYFNTVVEGIENTTAPWIKILEPDDFFAQGSLRKILDIIDNTNCDVLLTNVWTFKDNKIKKRIHPFYRPLPGYINMGNPFIHTLTFKRELVKDLRQVSGRRFSFGDNIIVDMIRQNHKKLIRTKLPFYIYRKGHEGQSTAKGQSLRTRPDYWRVVEATCELNYGVGNKSTAKLLKFAYVRAIKGRMAQKENVKELIEMFKPIKQKYNVKFGFWAIFQFLFVHVKILRPILKLFLAW